MLSQLHIKARRLLVKFGMELKPYVSNKRYRWGIIILLVIAPFAKHFYLLFPVTGLGEYIIDNGFIQLPNILEDPEYDWYYISFRNYFWTIGEILAPLIIIIGMFLLFPKKYYPSYLALVPLGYYFTLLIHRLVTSSNSEYRDGFTISITLGYMLFGIILFVISDKIILYKNRKYHAAEARIKGVINMPGVKWSDKEELLRKEIA